VRPLYGSFAWAYDLIVARPGGPPADTVATALERRGVAPGSRVVDAGCGTGARTAAFAAAGYDVIGIDSSAGLVEQARLRAPGVEFVVGDLREWLPEAPCDAVLCRGVLNDFVADRDRRDALRGLRRMLRPGGVAVLDARPWEESVAHYAAEPVFEQRVPTARGELRFRSQTVCVPRRHTLEVAERYSLGDDEERFSFVMRCWTRAELHDGLLDAGFSAVELPASDLAPARRDRIVAVASA
jgi:SAM-dependent methyltransferase